VLQGLISAGQQLSDQEAANLIFMPGFSTATQVTELQGRGIGMDVVRARSQRAGGAHRDHHGSRQKGTNFSCTAPDHRGDPGG